MNTTDERGEKVCAYCDRAAYVRVMHEGRPESRCDWHQFGGRLPVVIRRRSFNVNRLSDERNEATDSGCGGDVRGQPAALEQCAGETPLRAFTADDPGNERASRDGAILALQMGLSAEGDPMVPTVAVSPPGIGGGVPMTDEQAGNVAGQRGSGRSQAMFPEGKKGCGLEAKATRKPTPKPWLGDWWVRPKSDGHVAGRQSEASFDPRTQVLWCSRGNRQDCNAPDFWDIGDELTCHECGAIWVLEGPDEPKELTHAT